MEPKVHYFVVGLFVLFLSAAFVAALLWFSASQHKVHVPYLLDMKEAVSGLNEQAPVKFNGVEVGYVDKISLNPVNPQQVELLLQIEKGTPINQSTTASLMAQGITGITYIGLKAAAVSAPKLKLQPGRNYPVIPSTPSLLVQLNSAVREVTADLKEINDAFQKLLSKENQAAIQHTLVHLDQFSGVLAKNAEEINLTIKNASAALGQTQNFAQTLNEQTLPSITQAVNQLNGVLGKADQLTETLSANPSVLIRGAQPKALGPGE